MLSDTRKFLERNKMVTEEDMYRAIHTLRERQFIYRNGHGERAHYLLISEHRDYFVELFSSVGDMLIVSDEHDYVGLLPKVGVSRMTVAETRLFLVMRCLYEDEMLSGRSGQASVEVDWDTFRTQHESLTGRELPDKKTAMLELMNSIGRRGVSKLKFYEEEDDLPRITILPSIMALVSNTTLAQLKEQLQERAQTGTPIIMTTDSSVTGETP